MAEADERLTKLIRSGYFPAELPPPFTTATYADNAVTFSKKWPGDDIRGRFWTAPEIYSIPRLGDVRRKLSLVNPVNQLHISHLVSANWPDIKERLERSQVTEFKPEFSKSEAGRAITGVDFDGVARDRARLLATFGRYVRTDIARFYPSIYTHSIAWAILGKGYVKAKHKAQAFKASFANHLDKAVGAGQEGQTIGIPIGPDTSRIFAELIAVEIEQLAKIHVLGFEERAVRFVDDILIGLNDHETAAAVLSGLSLALYEYQLELNPEKTSTFGLGCAHTPEWVHFIQNFRLNPREKRQRTDLDSFFEHAFFLSDQNRRENVLLFAAKKAASFRLRPANVEHFVRWMLYCARRSPTCLSFVAEHLSATKGDADMAVREIEPYILQQIPSKAASGHTEELAWLLFWAREIGLAIPCEKMTNVLALRSSVVALLTLDLWHRGLIKGALDFSLWQGFANAEGLKSEMWLVAYEATRKGWWPRRQPSDFISTHQFFSDLWGCNVQFYDPESRARKRVRIPAPKKVSDPAAGPSLIGYASSS